MTIAKRLSLPSDFDRYAPIKPGILWSTCEDNGDTQCGRFEVPLDYNNTLAGKASLMVAKYPATAKGPKMGTLFINPGGPGGSGVETILGGLPEQIMEIVKGKYDIVSWDPRGVGSTFSRVDCFDNSTEEKDFWKGTIPDAGLEARGDFTEERDLEAFYAQEPEVNRLLEILGNKCAQYGPKIVEYVGTAATVRDMVALNDYLSGKDTLINFWGLSYGSAVGIYLINMFPESVGHVILDGVVDPVYYANRPPHEGYAIDADSIDNAYMGFVTACARAGSDHCAFSSKGSTSEELDRKTRKLVDLAYEYKVKEKQAAIFGSAYMRGKLFHGMYLPENWPEFAKNLQKCWEALNNIPGSSLSQCIQDDLLKSQTAPSETDPAPDYAFQAITCADAVDRGGVTTRMVFENLVNVTRTVSHMFGPMWGTAGFYCHQWPRRAVERFTGPWTRPTIRNKVIVIGNEADPITPFRSAKSVADTLGSKAMLIEQKGFGHTSFAMHSKCTLDLVQSYFMDELSEWGTKVCQIDKEIFTAVSMSMLTSPLSSSSNTESSEPTYRLYFVFLAPICSVGILLVLFIKSWAFGQKGMKHLGHTSNSGPVMVADEEKGAISHVSHIESKSIPVKV